ncbi:hypothetical protein F2Q68_00019746 [Brassica cretica]|uniref:Uncharacterized protein n=1 Tax=Brassica cretica TaxID=69181 RepID=A0A8S9FVQ8_BRACR|nr:hypothetical protein F2Q68_00019746 [Brassica cretica]
MDTSILHTNHRWLVNNLGPQDNGTARKQLASLAHQDSPLHKKLQTFQTNNLHYSSELHEPNPNLRARLLNSHQRLFRLRQRRWFLEADELSRFRARVLAALVQTPREVASVGYVSMLIHSQGWSFLYSNSQPVLDQSSQSSPRELPLVACFHVIHKASSLDALLIPHDQIMLISPKYAQSLQDTF